jgi:hypothetical protein
MEIECVQLEKKLAEYLQKDWPLTLSWKVEKDSEDYRTIEGIARSQGLNTKDLVLSIVVRYRLTGFEIAPDGQGHAAVFACDPYCVTANPNDWWWTSQRNTESFKNILRKATGTGIAHRFVPDVELVTVPSMTLPEDDIDDPGLYISERKYWRFVQK